MFTKKNFLTLASLAFMGLGLSACETIGGAGRDIQSAGHSVEKASE